jgi:hypothetical protein
MTAIDHEESRSGRVLRVFPVGGRPNREAEAIMERFQGSLLSIDPALFGDSRATVGVAPGLGHEEWLGRLWLPADDRVDPTRSFCLLRTDGRVGEMVMDRFAMPETL